MSDLFLTVLEAGGLRLPGLVVGLSRACPFADIYPEPSNSRESQLFPGCSDEGAREGSTVLTLALGGRC